MVGSVLRNTWCWICSFVVAAWQRTNREGGASDAVVNMGIALVLLPILACIGYFWFMIAWYILSYQCYTKRMRIWKALQWLNLPTLLQRETLSLFFGSAIPDKWKGNSQTKERTGWRLFAHFLPLFVTDRSKQLRWMRTLSTDDGERSLTSIHWKLEVCNSYTITISTCELKTNFGICTSS